MKQGFNMAFLAQTNVLGRMLGNGKSFRAYTEYWEPVTHINVQYEEEYMVIPVYVKYKGGTVQQLEDGIVTMCTHAGAKWGTEIDSTYYMSFDGEREHIFNIDGYFCDQCPAWSYDQEDWNE